VCGRRVTVVELGVDRVPGSGEEGGAGATSGGRTAGFRFAPLAIVEVEEEENGAWWD
jgi:hypothetical protein